MEEVKNTKKIRLVYILSASHSGSTLLAMLLNAHPDICTVGELKATSLGDVDLYLCSCRKKIKECPFWINISQDMAGKGISFDITDSKTHLMHNSDKYIRFLLSPLHRGPVLEMIRDAALSFSLRWKKQLAEFQNVNYMLMKCVLERTGKSILVDSSKIGIRLKYLLNNPRLDLKVIRLIRDGRGVALSYTDPAKYADSKNMIFRGGGMNAGNEKPRTIDRAAHEWRRSNEEAEEIIKYIDRKQWIEIRYENLCADTDVTIRNIYHFLEVDSQGDVPEFRSIQHHILGNGMRLDMENEIHLDERWKVDLTLQDLQVFESIAGKINRYYDYA